jgi:hypothetical protein
MYFHTYLCPDINTNTSQVKQSKFAPFSCGVSKGGNSTRTCCAIVGTCWWRKASCQVTCRSQTKPVGTRATLVFPSPSSFLASSGTPVSGQQLLNFYFLVQRQAISNLVILIQASNFKLQFLRFQNNTRHSH